MTQAQTVSEALESLRRAIEAEHVQKIQARVASALEGLSLNGNGHAPAQPKRRTSKAGRARIAASAKARWKAYRAAKARAK